MNPRKPLLRLRVSAAAESRIRARHPWLFSESIRDQNREGELGELAVIYDRQDRFLAVGLFDPDSPIRVRVLHVGKPRTLDAAWFRARWEQAMAVRAGLLDDRTNAGRLLHGESDGWPGLVLDRYDRTFVLKLYTAAWLVRLEEIVELLREVLPALLPAGREPRLILRLSRNIQEMARDRFQRVEGAVLFGPPVEGPVQFLESGLRFEADVIRGQKTGFFLDQRENRRRVETLASGRAVLNAFSFSGGFSLYAARGGARAVTDLDISTHALESARRNFALNVEEPAVARCVHDTVQADAFEWLERASAVKFDLVVLDPPSLAKREAERERAIQAYARLAGLGLQRLRPGGILVAASCSAHVTSAEFYAAVREAARLSGRKHSVLDTTGHPPDHPAAFREAQYLKCLYLQLED